MANFSQYSKEIPSICVKTIGSYSIYFNRMLFTTQCGFPACITRFFPAANFSPSFSRWQILANPVRKFHLHVKRSYFSSSCNFQTWGLYILGQVIRYSWLRLKDICYARCTTFFAGWYAGCSLDRCNSGTHLFCWTSSCSYLGMCPSLISHMYYIFTVMINLSFLLVNKTCKNR